MKMEKTKTEPGGTYNVSIQRETRITRNQDRSKSRDTSPAQIAPSGSLKIHHGYSGLINNVITSSIQGSNVVNNMQFNNDVDGNYNSKMAMAYVTRRVENGRIKEIIPDNYLNLQQENERLVTELEDAKIKRGILQKTNDSLLSNQQTQSTKIYEMNNENKRLYDRTKELEQMLYNNNDKEQALALRESMRKTEAEYALKAKEQQNEIDRLKSLLSKNEAEMAKLRDLSNTVHNLEKQLAKKDMECKQNLSKYEQEMLNMTTTIQKLQ